MVDSGFNFKVQYKRAIDQSADKKGHGHMALYVMAWELEGAESFREHWGKLVHHKHLISCRGEFCQPII